MACPQRGRKRESSGESGRKQGSAPWRVNGLRQFARPAIRRVPAKPIDVNEPAGTAMIVAISGVSPTSITTS
jgi:hypothetical protein